MSDIFMTSSAASSSSYFFLLLSLCRDSAVGRSFVLFLRLIVPAFSLRYGFSIRGYFSLSPAFRSSLAL